MNLPLTDLLPSIAATARQGFNAVRLAPPRARTRSARASFAQLCLLAASFALFAFGATPAPAQVATPKAAPNSNASQGPADVFDDRIVVREATLHVRVRGRRGPITGLTEDRFAVRLGDTPLPMLAFEELQSAPKTKRRSGDPDVETVGLLGRNLLVIFDARFTPRPYLQEAVRATRRSLDELGPEDRMAVVLWTSRAQLVLPFTNDPNQLEAAFLYLSAHLDAKPREAAEAAKILGDLSSETSTRLGLGLRAELTRRSPSIGETVDFSFVNQFATFDPAESLESVALAEANELSGLLERSNEALADLARSLSDVTGPRYAILFGRGVPGFQTLLQGRAAWDAGTISTVTASFNQLTYRLRGNGWVVDTVDVSGVGGRSTAVSMADNSPRSFDSQSIAAPPRWVERGGLAGNDSGSLFLIAEQTGGDLHDNHNNLRDALRRSLDASSHAYRLVVQVPAEAQVERRRGMVRLNVNVEGLPLRATVRHSFGADWAIPAHLRKASEVENAHAELVGTRRANVLSPVLARMAIHRRPDSSGPRLERALLAIDIDPSIARGAKELSLIAVASPLEIETGDGSVFDLWTENVPAADLDADALLAYPDLLIPCTGARIRLRLATDRGESWVTEQTLGDRCDEATGPVAVWQRADDDTARFIHQGQVTSPLLRSRVRLSVLTDQTVDVRLAGSAASSSDADPVAFVLAPQAGSGKPLERSATRPQSAKGDDAFSLTFDVPPGHYLVRPATAAPSTAALVSVY